MTGGDVKMDSVDTNNFSVVRQDGNLAVYQCNYCKEEFKEPGAVSKVRRHIPSKHKVRKGVPEPIVKGMSVKRKPADEVGLVERKKKKEEPPVELTSSQAATLSDPRADPLLQELESEDTIFSYMTSTQISKEVDDILYMEDDKPDENEKSGSCKDVYENTTQEHNEIMELKQIIQDEQLKVSELQVELETKKETELLHLGTIGSLEEERDSLKHRMAKLEPVLLKFRTEVQKLKSEQDNSGEMAKLKKELKKSEARCEDLVGQVESLTVSKTKALAEASRMTTMCDSLMELQKAKTGDVDTTNKEEEKGASETTKDDDKNKSKKKCDRYEHGACTWGSNCRDQHPTRICGAFKNSGKCNRTKCEDVHDRRKEDCWYWMDGRCNKTTLMECKGKHDKDKKGVNKSSKSFLDERQMEELAERVVRRMEPPARGQQSWGGRGGAARGQGRGQEGAGGQGDMQQEIRRCLAGHLGGQ